MLMMVYKNSDLQQENDWKSQSCHTNKQFPLTLYTT
jgi:hypothetical protein